MQPRPQTRATTPAGLLLCRNTEPTTPEQVSLQPAISRLEATLCHPHLTQCRVLVPAPPQASVTPSPEPATNLVVGYNGSAYSRAVLALTLGMAEQKQSLQPHPVLVHVVYVIDKIRPKTIAQADRILWQARCFASEWRGKLHAHLRVGPVALALHQIAAAIAAEALLVGCYTPNHPLVQQLASEVSYPILGLPW